jgi:hypothetical protein
MRLICGEHTSDSSHRIIGTIVRTHIEETM